MKKLFIIGVIAMIIYSCAPVRVSYDYDKLADFNVYKTYNYHNDMNTGMNALDEKRLMEVLDRELQRKGLSRSDSPDIFINIKSSTYQEPRNNNVGVGVGGGGGHVGGGISIGLPIGQSKIERELVFEFVDKNKFGLVWQAISHSNYRSNENPEVKEATFQKIVEKVLTGYPPARKD